jgi:glycosyltransferase involved in cell wall biosynthesis
MKRIGYYCADINPEITKSLGIYKSTIFILKELISQMNRNNKLSIFVTKENYSFFKQFKSDKVDLIKIKKPFKNYIMNRILIDQILINKEAVKAKIDILFFPKGILPLFKKKKMKYVAIIWDLIPNYYLENKKYSLKTRLKFLPVSWLLTNSIKKADKIFTISEYSKKQILKYCNKDITVIPLGSFSKTKSALKTIKFKPPKNPYFYIIGNLNPHKNLKKSIELFLEYNQLNDNKFDAVITSKIDGNLKKYQNKSIHFLGVQGEEGLEQIYKNSQLSIFLSEIEGFGLPLIESYYYKTPVVFNKRTSLKEIGKGLKGGCKINNKKSVFRAIDEVLKMKKSEILKIRDEFNNRYNWERCVKKIIKYLNEK